MSRSRRFEQRINIERAALEIVNTSQIAYREQLAGLTAAAIESWAHRVKDWHEGEQVTRLRQTLTALATETGLLSDNSRAVFSSGTQHDSQTVVSLLASLKSQCSISGR